MRMLVTNYYQNAIQFLSWLCAFVCKGLTVVSELHVSCIETRTLGSLC